MKVTNLSESCSVLNTYLAELRSTDIQPDSMRFRCNIERIGQIMAYEISKTLSYQSQTIQTPLDTIDIPLLKDQLVLGTILRAGLPFHQGFLHIFDHAENAFISAFRREEVGRRGEVKLEIVSEYLAAPSVQDKTLLLVDPMLATGMSMEVAYKALLSHGEPSTVHLACVITTQQGIDYLERTMPEHTHVWCAAIDRELNEQKYIVPGLGDAGDLCYGAKL